MSETIEDIVREMRSIKGGQHTNGGRSYEIWRISCKVADDYADRIEAAAKEMREENAKLKADLMVKYQRCYCSRLASAESDNIRFKAALKPVLDIVMDDATSDLAMAEAIDEAHRIYKEGESK